MQKMTTVQSMFLNSLRSEFTRDAYRKTLPYFCKFLNIEPNNFDLLLRYITSKERKELEHILISYILYLKEEKRLSPNSVCSYLNPIRHFFKMNDIVNINWYKINRFQDRKHTITKDRPYTRQELDKLLGVGNLRDRVVILLMSSAGLRIGALPSLKLRDLKPIDKYNLYQITVYAGTESEYITFTTPECRKHIDEYIQLRQRYREQLTSESPLLRIHFDTFSPCAAALNKKIELSYHAVKRTVRILLNKSGVRPRRKATQGIDNQRTELMADHALRKYFSSTLETEGVNPVYVELLLGHDLGLKTVYSRPTPAQLLEGNGNKVSGYIHGIDALTINEENRLKMTIKDLTDKQDEMILIKVKHDQEIKSIREEMENKFQQILSKVDIPTLK